VIGGKRAITAKVGSSDASELNKILRTPTYNFQKSNFKNNFDFSSKPIGGKRATTAKRQFVLFLVQRPTSNETNPNCDESVIGFWRHEPKNFFLVFFFLDSDEEKKKHLGFCFFPRFFCIFAGRPIFARVTLSTSRQKNLRKKICDFAPQSFFI
jgi:hypothetical protein